MELIERIEDINLNLERHYGKTFDDRPNFRVVWANDQLEKRWVETTEEGLALQQAEVREVRKYKGIDYKNFYILERLVPVIESDLVEKVSYEPAWVFRDKNGNYIPPRFDMCCIVVDSLHEAAGKKGGFRKYTDPSVDPNYRMAQIDKMQQDLFGNETSVGDSLAYKEAVVVPQMPKIEIPASVLANGGKNE